MKRQRNCMRMTVFLIVMILTAPSFAAIIHEEPHGHGPHRHLQYEKMKNPVAMTEQSIAQGRQLYEKHCLACHGESGKGGIGPSLTGPARMHGGTDGEIFHVITDGVAGTAMKGFKKELPDKTRWDLVNYIKSLEKKKRAK